MTFCYECGKPVVPPSAKFCRNCGASQYAEPQQPAMPTATPFPESVSKPLPVVVTSPLPLSQQSNFPQEVPREQVIPNVCKSCGSSINPDEKYCGICGSPLGEHNITVLHKQEILASGPVGVCTSCGSTRFETGKFCGTCGASSVSIPKLNSQSPMSKNDTPPPQQHPEPAAMKVCRSCGSPLSGTELFCGICGKPAQSTSPAISAFQQIEGKTCSNCGKPIRVTTRFCGACGIAVGSK